MIATITVLVVRLAAIRWAFKTIFGLGALLPIAMVLKVVGLPVMAVLGVLSVPVLIVLLLFGLPIFMVLAVGGMLLAGLFALMSFGLAAIKVFIFVVLPIILVWKLAGYLWRLARPATSAAPKTGYAGL